MIDMPMISSSGAVRDISSMVRKLKPGYEIEMKTFKKDRGIEIVKMDDGSLSINEFGFRTAEYHTSADDFDRLFKDIYQREFPRSHEIRYSIRRKR
ncbi:hypothetical protein [Thermoplasma sp. Kam2015]|uniref:hypothetical protein n=1 Tax=Thermoplasma sp. Kam2015 TaxID=2094122 RepID=UPI001F326A66|nr:hypothetical protein [Thermoplasma sp. Kam2015]